MDNSNFFIVQKLEPPDQQQQNPLIKEDASQIPQHLLSPITRCQERRNQLCQIHQDLLAFNNDLAQQLARLEDMIRCKVDRGDIDQFIDQIAEKFQGINIGDLKLSIDDEPSLRIVSQERTINTLFNRKVYMKEVESVALNQREMIIKEFAPELQENVNEITFSYQQVKGETHHLGKSPVFISLQINGVTQKRVVYKPRDARIDEKVMETLTRINNLPEEHRSGTEPLATYHIINLDQNQGSFWQFIEGTQFDLSEPRLSPIPDSIGNYLRKFKLDDEETMRKLNRLDAILSAMRVSDLHIENTILQEGPTSKTVVCIDFENILPPGSQNRTFLDGDPAIVQLTEQEIELINKFIASYNSIPHRAVLMRTDLLLALIGNPENALRIATQCCGQALVLGYTSPEMDTFRLAQEILFSMLNGEIPYFTENNNILYYEQDPNKQIASRN